MTARGSAAGAGRVGAPAGTTMALEALDIPVEVQHHEVGTAGQTEIDIRFVVLSVPGLASFFDGEAGDGEGGERVGPPPADEGVENQADQQDGPCFTLGTTLLERRAVVRLRRALGRSGQRRGARSR